MTRSKYAASVFALVLPALALSADESRPATRASSASSALSTGVAGIPKAKIKPKITLSDSISVPGDTKTFTAVVEVGGAPKAGLDVKFSIDGHGSVGHAATKADGKSSVSFTVPNDFKAQSWNVKADTAATDEYFAAEATAKLNVIPGATTIELGDLIWGTYKGEPGSPSGSIIVTIRQSYGAKNSLQVPFKMTVNGNTWNISAGILYMIPLPTNATTWTCSATFDGNDSYTGSTGGPRTYKKPN